MNKMKKILTALGATVTLGFFSGYVAFAHTVPGWDEPYDIDAYYSLTEISWADSPSPYALKDLASNGGNVFDYTRYIKSILFGEKFKNILEVATNKTLNDEINTTPFDEKIFAETSDALKILTKGTEKVSKQIDSQEIEKNLQQGDDDEWENFNPDFNHEEKFLWLNQQYKNFAEGANEEVNDLENVFKSADKILNHTNLAEGNLQEQQARNELLTLLAYELARKNALDANFEQMQALYQMSEYDKNVESAYMDSITKFDVAEPYDAENYKLLREEYDYKKPEPVGMPDFK